MRALGGIGANAETALPLFIFFLDDPEIDNQIGAIDGLRRFAARKINRDLFKPAIPGLIRALEPPRLRRQSIWALREIGPLAAPAVPKLMAFLKDKNEQIRYSTVVALGRIGIGAKESLELLSDLMDQDPNQYVREAAKTAIGEISKKD
jgi:HEAT repeat protein